MRFMLWGSVHLNQMSTNIQFTIEKEEEGRLAFLDVLVTHSKDQLSTAVYRKPTHMDRYIPYHSHHHPRMLTRVMRGMRDRALRICDNTRVFEANGFPGKLVRKTLTKPQRQQTCEPDEEEPPKTLHLPYVRGLSEKIEKTCGPLGVKAIFKPQSTLKQQLVRVKQKMSEEKRIEVVFIPGSLQGLPQGIHWGDQENTKDQNK